MSEHKPGPKWVQGPYEIQRVEEEGCRCTAIRQVNGPQVGVVDDRGMTDAQIDGTATLFAAAPEMFEALEAAAESLANNGFGKAFVIDLIAAVLAKARAIST